MPALKILPGNIANMIAAGEVVQRPASVIKELMENAVDAGATSVNVIVTDSGRTLMQVIDNGCGMSPSDALLCFERHATSKIATAEDLEAISTYGFRGEALASIAAVAEVTLKTRRPQDETATQVHIAEYNKVTTSVTAAPVGSNFMVRNLFYNTPARRKFLKSDAVELKHIVEEFTRVALTRPEVGFTLTNNGHDIYVLKPAKSLKFRIMDLMGAAVAGDIVDVSADTSLMRVRGYIGRPDGAKKTVGNQFFFVNGRYFRSPYLHKAVMKAYEDFIPVGVTPSYFLYLETDPHSMDVNIHPSKTEVKFEDEPVVFQVLYACIRESLGRNSFGASIDFDAAGAVDMPSFGKSFDAYHPVTAPAADFDPTFNPFDEQGPAASAASGSGGLATRAGGGALTGGAADGPGGAAAWDDGADGDAPSGQRQEWQGLVRRDQDYGKLFDEHSAQPSKILVLQGKYILSEVPSGVMLVHARRALERILYERFLDAMSHDTPVSQQTLFPVQVQVGAANRLLFDKSSEELRRLGFDITPFGTDTVVVNGVPEGYGSDPGKVEAMVFDLLLVLSDNTVSVRETMAQTRSQRLAILGASTSPGVSSPTEAQRLLDGLLACETPEFAPGGRRIISIIGIDELDKRLH